MNVEFYERIWMWAAVGLIVIFMGTVVGLAASNAVHPPSHMETIDPGALADSPEFSNPGVIVRSDGSVVVTVVACSCQTIRTGGTKTGSACTVVQLDGLVPVLHRFGVSAQLGEGSGSARMVDSTLDERRRGQYRQSGFHCPYTRQRGGYERRSVRRILCSQFRSSNRTSREWGHQDYAASLLADRLSER